VAVLLKTKSSALVAKMFIRQWVNWAGAPRKLQYDRGGEFEGHFEAMLERLNIESYVVPTDAARQAGLGERHGGIMKTMHRAIVHETSARGHEEMEITLLEACLAKNQADKKAWVLADSARAWAGHSPAGFGALWPDGAQCP
jgi:hypothetical protein